MSMQKMYKTLQKLSRRAVAGLMALAVVVGLFPGVIPAVSAASWSQPYVDRLVELGIMRDDIPGNKNPDDYISRAETFTLINRAFGYSKTGTIPFTDVSQDDWFYDDIVTAYNIGYISGTSPTTASPNSSLTREQAAYILGSNLMLQEGSGESLTFSDSRTFDSWSRGMIQAASEAGLISGYPDGTFRPQNRITRGELCCMLLNAVGNLVQTPGVTSLGNVYSNVTINTAGAVLKDTTIAGNLYLTGGIGLGEVLLDNVNVLGKIVTSGAGEGNQGDSSIILRNVRADEMIVDTVSNQFVTIQAQGNTNIGLTSVRTPSYLQDMTGQGFGLQKIHLDGEPGTSVQLVGNIKEVTNLTPSSIITVAQGTTEKITVDEAATNAQLQILEGGRVKDLNLDVATNVGGAGDIDNLTVYAPGSTVTTTLPNTITVRPGITANVSGEVMDTVAAAESSEDPRLLAGFPVVRNVAPTTAEAVFSTNKRGTIYWALTALTDGSVSAQDLINHPAYSSRILAYGQIPSTGANTEYTAKLTKLVSDGSYYVSAVMVDNRNQQSPVKVAAFTTPDDTTPAFASGYPKATLVTSDSVQVGVMPNKSCQLYYAILPKGSTAPTVQDFRAGSISGNLGYGMREVTKNVIDVFNVNSQSLRELTDYTVYLCLVDLDSGKNSGVKSLNVKTVDGTPPVFLVEPYETKIAATSVTLSSTINEAGTIYWVAVKEGESYPKPLSGSTGTPLLTSDTAKLQVANGMNALKSGSVRAAANKAVNLNITGLTAQSAYDVYYVAMDSAGNYSEAVKKVTIHTLDTVPPKVTLEFTRTTDTAGTVPRADTDLKLVFDESIQGDPSGYTGTDTLVFKTAYEDMVAAWAAANAAQGTNDQESLKREAERVEKIFVDLLKSHISLIDADAYSVSGDPPAVADRKEAKENEAWVDYSKVTVTFDDNGNTIIYFKNGEAVSLVSGASYYFRLEYITDTSTNHNRLKPNPHEQLKFTTSFAQINLTKSSLTATPKDANVNMYFQMRPVSTDSVSDTVLYDILLWMDNSVSNVKYKIYGRVLDSEGDPVTDTSKMSIIGRAVTEKNKPDGNGWVTLGEDEIVTDPGQKVGKSLTMRMFNYSTQTEFTPLNKMDLGCVYEFAIEVTEVNGEKNQEAWSQRVQLDVTVPAGTEYDLRNLGNVVNETSWANAVSNGVANIGRPDDFFVYYQFVDQQTPQFQPGYPSIDAADTSANLVVNLNRAGTVFWAVAPVTYSENSKKWTQYLTTKVGDRFVVPDVDSVSIGKDDLKAPENDIANWDKVFGGKTLTTPTSLDIFQHNFGSQDIKWGIQTVSGSGRVEIPVVKSGDSLLPNTPYLAYFVLRGTSQELSEVYCFWFKTAPVKNPIITLQGSGSTVNFEVSEPSNLDYVILSYSFIPEFLRASFGEDDGTTSGYAIKGFSKGFTPTDIDMGKDGDDANFSVLDALIAKTPDGHSVFDTYAKPITENSIRQDVAQLARGEGAFSGYLMGNSNILSMAAGRGESRDMSNVASKPLTTGQQYLVLAVARNVRGEVDSFAAVNNVRVQDTTPPEFSFVATSIQHYYKMEDDGTWKEVPFDKNDVAENPGSYHVSGQVTIVFDKDVWYMGPNSIGVPIYVKGIADDQKVHLPSTTIADGKDHVYLEGHIMANFNVSTVAVSSSSSSFTLEFHDAQFGNMIHFPSSNRICNSSSWSTGKSLTLTLSPAATQSQMNAGVTGGLVDPVVGPGFTYMWK